MKTELALWRQLILLLTALETPETNEGTIITQNTTRSFVLLRSRDLSCSVTSNVALSHGRPALCLTIASGGVGVGVVGVKSLEFGETFLAPLLSLVSICPGLPVLSLSLNSGRSVTQHVMK